MTRVRGAIFGGMYLATLPRTAAIFSVVEAARPAQACTSVITFPHAPGY